MVLFSLEKKQFALTKLMCRSRTHGITRDHTQMLSGFLYGKTQHVRSMRLSIISVIYYRFFICHMISGSATAGKYSFFFQVVVVGRFQPITPFSLNIKKPGEWGTPILKRQGVLVGKFEFNSKKRLMCTLLELQ